MNAKKNRHKSKGTLQLNKMILIRKIRIKAAK
jgi:hypothetical protein